MICRAGTCHKPTEIGEYCREHYEQRMQEVREEEMIEKEIEQERAERKQKNYFSGMVL